MNGKYDQTINDMILSDFNWSAERAARNDLGALQALANIVALNQGCAAELKLYDKLAQVLRALRKTNPLKAKELLHIDKTQDCAKIVRSLTTMAQDLRVSDLDLIADVKACMRMFPESSVPLLGDFNQAVVPKRSLASYGILPKNLTMRSSVKIPVVLSMIAADITKYFKLKSEPVVITHIKQLLAVLETTQFDQYGLKIAMSIAPTLRSLLDQAIAEKGSDHVLKFQEYFKMLNCALDQSCDPTESYQTFLDKKTTEELENDWVHVQLEI